MVVATVSDVGVRNEMVQCLFGSEGLIFMALHWEIQMAQAINGAIIQSLKL